MRARGLLKALRVLARKGDDPRYTEVMCFPDYECFKAAYEFCETIADIVECVVVLLMVFALELNLDVGIRDLFDVPDHISILMAVVSKLFAKI